MGDNSTTSPPFQAAQTHMSGLSGRDVEDDGRRDRHDKESERSRSASPKGARGGFDKDDDESAGGKRMIWFGLGRKAEVSAAAQPPTPEAGAIQMRPLLLRLRLLRRLLLRRRRRRLWLFLAVACRECRAVMRSTTTRPMKGCFCRRRRTCDQRGAVREEEV